ncbi:MAG: hypothetical protein ACE5DR_01810 [Thermodesulfobacteriota bacterium]
MRQVLRIIAFAALSTAGISCAAAAPVQVGETPERPVAGQSAAALNETPRSLAPLPRRHDFVPASEDLSPLKTKIISLSLRNNPMKEAVYAIAEATGLNVVMNSGVNPEVPITISLAAVTAEEALSAILSSINYFYTLKGNILIISALDTRVFEMGRPSVIQEYAVNVGGDILGAARDSGSGVTGEVSQKMSSDNLSFKFWDTLEKSLQGILGLGSGVSGSTEAGDTLTVDRMTGTIMVTSTRNNLIKVERFLRRVREVLNRQVVIEARIVEVKLTGGLKYGIDWSFLGGGIQGVGVLGGGTAKFTDILSNAANFNFTVDGGDFNSVLKALKEQGELNILSNPRVNIMNGQTAVLSVGRKVDFVSRVETTTQDTTAGSTPIITFTVETGSILSGLMFGIVPYVEDNGREVTLSITPVISDLVKLEDKKVGDVGSNSIEISLPTVDLRELSTTVKVGNGDMVIIGGLMESERSIDDKAVPILSEIPLVGPLFTSRDKKHSKTELVIMLRPVVMEQGGSYPWER